MYKSWGILATISSILATEEVFLCQHLALELRLISSLIVENPLQNVIDAKAA